MSDELQSKILQIIAEKARTEESKITPESNFTKDLGMDSLDKVELVMAIEEEFSCEIPDSEAAKIATVADAIEYVKNHLNKE